MKGNGNTDMNAKASAMMRAVFCAAISLSLPVTETFSAISVKESTRTIENHDTRVVEVETAIYKAVFNLDFTGSADSLFCKPFNQEFRAEGRWGLPLALFSEFLRMADPNPVTGYTRRLGDEELKYQTKQKASFKILKESPGEIILEFEWPCSTKGGLEWMAKVINRRRVCLRDDTPAITVEYEVENTDAEAHSAIADIYNSVSLGRVPTALYMPEPTGKVVGEDEKAAASFWYFSEEPPAAWIGGVNAQGLGVGFSFDIADLDCMQADGRKPLGAAYGVAMRRRELPAGGKVVFKYTFLPFNKFGTLDGMSGDLAGGILVGDKADFENEVDKASLKPGVSVPVKVFLAGGAKRKVDARIACVRQEDKKEVFSEARSIDMVPGETAVMESKIVFPEKGLYVVKVAVEGSDKSRLEIEKPVRFLESRLTYAAPEPKGERRGKRDAGVTLMPPLCDPEMRQVDLSFVTPHEPYLKNHACGPVKAFFAVMGKNNTPGHVRELAQRNDLAVEYNALDFMSTSWPEINSRSVREFEKAFAKSEADVLVSIGINWHAGLREKTCNQILDRVRSGMGAVVVIDDLSDKKQPEMASAIAEAKEITGKADLPALAVGFGDVRRFELGKGRLVLIVCRLDIRDGGLPMLSGWENCGGAGIPEFRWRGFEYSYLYVGDLIRWAARKESPLVVAGASLDGDTVAVDVLNNGPAAAGRCLVRSRSRRWEALGEGKADVEFPAGASKHTVKLSAIPYEGTSALEIQLLDKSGKVLAFGSSALKREGGTKIGIAHVPEGPFPTMEKPGVCKVEVSGATNAAVLSASVFDRFGRLVLRKDKIAVANGNAAAELDLKGFMPLDAYHELIAETRSAGGALLAQSSADVILVEEALPFKDCFMPGVYGAPTRSPLHIQALVQAARGAGLKLHSHNQYSPLLYSTGGRSGIISWGMLALRSGYPVEGVKPAKDDKTFIMSPPLLPDDKAVAALKAKMQESWRKELAQGGRFSQIDDERGFPEGYDMSPQTLAGFRKWLPGRYRGIAELNAAWGSSFASFGDVVPKSRADLGDNAPNLAPWLDFRVYIGEVIGDYYMKLPSEWAREVSPLLHMGESGIYTPSASLPVDWSKYAKYYTCTAKYCGGDDFMSDIFRSFAPESVIGTYGGYGLVGTNVSLSYRMEPWFTLLNGGRFILYWSWSMVTFGYGVPTSDQQPGTCYRILDRDEFADLCGGLDRMIIAGKFSDDKIAMAYCYPSWVISGDALGIESRRLLRELGYQLVFRNADDLAGGLLEKDGYRMLVVQQASALGRDQVEGMKKFAGNGGTIVLSGRIGWRDLHGAPHKEGALGDALAGVDTASAAKLGQVVKAQSPFGPIEISAQYSNVSVKDAETLAAAEVDGSKIPLWTRKKIGKGQVYWVNSTLATDVEFLGGQAGEQIVTKSGPAEIRAAYQQMFDSMAQAAGIRPRFRLFKEGKPVLDGQTWVYNSQSGRSQYIARYSKEEVASPVQAELERTGHVYDLRARRHVGQDGKFAAEIKPGISVFAVLDYEVEGLDAKAEPASVKPGETVKVDCAVRAGGKTADVHALRIRVAGPSGEDLECYRQIVLARDGRTAIVLPTALNQQPGKYKLTAVDAVSGLSAVAEFKVE